MLQRACTAQHSTTWQRQRQRQRQLTRRTTLRWTAPPRLTSGEGLRAAAIAELAALLPGLAGALSPCPCIPPQAKHASACNLYHTSHLSVRMARARRARGSRVEEAARRGDARGFPRDASGQEGVARGRVHWTSRTGAVPWPGGTGGRRQQCPRAGAAIFQSAPPRRHTATPPHRRGRHSAAMRGCLDLKFHSSAASPARGWRSRGRPASASRLQAHTPPPRLLPVASSHHHHRHACRVIRLCAEGCVPMPASCRLRR